MHAEVNAAAYTEEPCIRDSAAFVRAGDTQSRRRVIWGVVIDGRVRPIRGAAVKLKNMITLNVRSFITEATASIEAVH
jgi:hypothetical protein